MHRPIKKGGKGYKFKRHGANHDIYEKDGEPLVIPRHQQKEIRVLKKMDWGEIPNPSLTNDKLNIL